MGLCLFIKVVKLLSLLMGLIFCKGWCPSRACLEFNFIYHGNGCSDRRCERWFINGLLYADHLVLCGESLNGVIDKYGG